MYYFTASVPEYDRIVLRTADTLEGLSCSEEKTIWKLYIARLENANTLATTQVLLSTPDYEWERKDFWVNEGPAVLMHDDKVYVTYSASDTGPAYCVGLLKADINSDLLDPRSWEKSRQPILKSDINRNLFGPGHNSFTKNEEGEDVIVFHTRTTDKLICENPLYAPNRHAIWWKLYKQG